MVAKALGTVAFSTTLPYRIAMHYAEILPTDYHFITPKFGNFKGGGKFVMYKKRNLMSENRDLSVL